MPSFSSRLGFHYFFDTLHYRDHDLQLWLPELHQLGASWLTVISPVTRAIPEDFLRGLISAGIQPVIHFLLPLDHSMTADDLRLLLRNYARWGVRYTAFFERPNARQSWSPAAWAQTELVERFLDIFMPFAQAAWDEGLTPVFSPLEPGGDYWDLAFLTSALRGIRRRKFAHLFDRMALGCYAWANNRPLDWGAGGPAQWLRARPYETPPGEQDHLGFRIFDWYIAISKEECERTLPVLLLRAGSCLGDQAHPGFPVVDEVDHAQRNLTLARWISGEEGEIRLASPIPEEVLCCNFWLLVAEANDPHASQAWFKSNGECLPVVDAFHRWQASRSAFQEASIPQPAMKSMDDQLEIPAEQLETETISRPISHYILLPLYAWGAAEWDLELIQPLLQQSHPTLGFSLEEASLAERVTVVGGEQVFPNQMLDRLRAAGCVVERVMKDGTHIASS